MSEFAKVAIVTDSISSLTQVMGQEHGVHVMPVYVFFGTQTYRDGIDLDAELFYRLLRGSEKLPTTSQPTAPDFVHQTLPPGGGHRFYPRPQKDERDGGFRPGGPQGIAGRADPRD